MVIWRLPSTVSSYKSHGIPQPLVQRPLDFQKLPIRCECIAECRFANLWPLGRLFRFDPARQCVPAGCGEQRECAEGSGHWRSVVLSCPLALALTICVDGELEELIEEFSEGRVQFAYVKVIDPNTGLPKNVLIAWCGEGVPERTKGYFTSHLASVSKFLHVSKFEASRLDW